MFKNKKIKYSWNFFFFFSLNNNNYNNNNTSCPTENKTSIEKNYIICVHVFIRITSVYSTYTYYI